MKHTIDLEKLREISMVGDWEGDEEIAAENFNKITRALYNAAPDNVTQEELEDIIARARDEWKDDQDLLTINDRQIERYVNNVWKE